MNKSNVNFEPWLARLKELVNEAGFSDNLIDEGMVLIQYENGEFCETVAAQVIETNTEAFNNWLIEVKERLSESEIENLNKEALRPAFNSSVSPDDVVIE